MKYKRFNIDEYSLFYFVLCVYLCKMINISDGQAKRIFLDAYSNVRFSNVKLIYTRYKLINIRNTSFWKIMKQARIWHLRTKIKKDSDEEEEEEEISIGSITIDTIQIKSQSSISKKYKFHWLNKFLQGKQLHYLTFH